MDSPLWLWQPLSLNRWYVCSHCQYLVFIFDHPFSFTAYLTQSYPFMQLHPLRHQTEQYPHWGHHVRRCAVLGWFQCCTSVSRLPHPHLHSLPQGLTLCWDTCLHVCQPTATLEMHSAIEDNLESLAYLLFYLLHRSLPWHNDTQLQQSTILEMKQSVSAKVMCKTFPSGFLQFLECLTLWFLTGKDLVSLWML